MMTRKQVGEKGKAAEAFTLLELLVVITIIGILAAVGLPAIRGMSKSNALAAADRQLIDDLGYARLRAMADHTTVFVVFVPPNVSVQNGGAFPLAAPSSSSASVNTAISNLYTKVFTTYALISLRSVGDQPGQHTPHYLTDWRTLPNGVYIATNKFNSVVNMAPVFFGATNQLQIGSQVVNTQVQFPFPNSTNVAGGSTAPSQADYCLPYIAFNYLGQLCYRTNRINGIDIPVVQSAVGQLAEYIPLARGSIMYGRNSDGSVDTTVPLDIQENPTGNAYYTSYTNGYTGQPFTGTDAGKVYNQIHIDPLTGRAHAETLQIQ